MKNLEEITNQRFNNSKPADAYLYTFYEVKEIIKSLLNEYEQTVSEDMGTPDVKEWFYQAIEELRDVVVPSQTNVKEGMRQ